MGNGDHFHDIFGTDIDDLKPVLHVTHKNADPDSFAGVLWGKRIFGGCTLVHNPSRTVKNLMEEIGFEDRICWDFRRVFAYDVNSPDKLPIVSENLIVIDHHPKNFFDEAKVYRRVRSSLSMNLYDISSGIDLPEDVLFSFAVALVTDTAILRTASSEELEYLSKFLGRRKMEDVYKVVFKGSVNMEDFLKDLNDLSFSGEVCYGRFSVEDHFMFFCDTFMYALGCKVVAGEFDWGVWIYSEKGYMQKVFKVLKSLEEKFRREGGKIIGADLCVVLSLLEDLLPL